MPHNDQHLCMTATAFVVHNKRILIGLHTKTGKYLPPGGHRDNGEAPHTTAVRETREETSLEIVLWQRDDDIYDDGRARQCPTPIFVDEHKIEDRRHYAFCYLATVKDGTSAVPVSNGELTNLQWASWLDVKALGQRGAMDPSVVRYCLRALQTERELRSLMTRLRQFATETTRQIVHFDLANQETE